MGNFRNGRSRVLFSLALIGSVGMGGIAFAQTPSGMSETQGATTGLGTSHRFHSLAAAQAHCSNDTIVWSASPNTVYNLPASPGYGKGHGFYACKAEADDAGFKPE